MNDSDKTVVLTPNRGKGKEIADYIARELGIPLKTRSFEVRVAVGEPITVKCDFFPTEPADDK